MTYVTFPCLLRSVQFESEAPALGAIVKSGLNIVNDKCTIVAQSEHIVIVIFDAKPSIKRIIPMSKVRTCEAL